MDKPGKPVDAPKILVVDDDPQVRNLLQDAFESMGCKVRAVSDPDQVPAIFLSEHFDLITLDYDMPELNGAQLHRLLSQEFGFGRRRTLVDKRTTASHRRLPPILLITAHAEEADVVVLQFRESVIGVIQKPFQLDDIREAVELALEHYSVRPERPDSVQWASHHPLESKDTRDS